MNEAETHIRDSIQNSGWFDDFTLELMGVTGNNRVFKLKAGKGEFLVKAYFRQPEDPRDRFATEHAFYSYLWEAGVRRTPRPASWLPEQRIALFEFIPGEKPVAATREMLQQALEFFYELNMHRQSAGAATLPIASAACFSIREHLQNVDLRFARLCEIEPGSDIDRSAIDFVAHKLQPAWQRIKDGLPMHGAGSVDEILPVQQRCVSPSDFGFHNSILTRDGKLLFFDFEYAGWDAPVNMVCDFFCQPAVPVDCSLMNEFAEGISEKLRLPGLRERAALLLPAYKIKWCCIMLNEFLPMDSRRRAFSNPGHDITARKNKQLEKAADALGQIPL